MQKTLFFSNNRHVLPELSLALNIILFFVLSHLTAVNSYQFYTIHTSQVYPIFFNEYDKGDVNYSSFANSDISLKPHYIPDPSSVPDPAWSGRAFHWIDLFDILKVPCCLCIIFSGWLVVLSFLPPFFQFDQTYDFWLNHPLFSGSHPSQLPNNQPFRTGSGEKNPSIVKPHQYCQFLFWSDSAKRGENNTELYIPRAGRGYSYDC